MRTLLDAPLDALKPPEHAFAAKVREDGFFRAEVFGDAVGPGFSYSTGFWVSTGQPEIIMFSIKGEIAHDEFWDMFRLAKGNTPLSLGKPTNQVFANRTAYVFPIAKRFYPDYLGWSRWFYGGDDFPCLQIVWPDREGVFPWEGRFDPAQPGGQPDLTEHGWQASLAN